MYRSDRMSSLSHRFCVAPMMDWTDRHCRFFLRQVSRHARLYTEMVTAPALMHGDVPRHRDVALAEGQLLAVALLEHVEELGGLHEFCFCLQVMQTRVHGMAFSRAGAIGSPQSRQMP